MSGSQTGLIAVPLTKASRFRVLHEGDGGRAEVVFENHRIRTTPSGCLVVCKDNGDFSTAFAPGAWILVEATTEPMS